MKNVADIVVCKRASFCRNPLMRSQAGTCRTYRRMSPVDRKSNRDKFVPLVQASIKNLTKGDMGLDMSAARKVYVKQWEYQSDDERYTVEIARGGKPVKGISSRDISSIDEEVMYWRKANHIHAWFVDNVQNGQDDCKTYHVSWDRLADLLSSCCKVLEASKLVDGLVNTGTVYDKKHPKGLAVLRPGKVIEDTTVAERYLPTRPGFFFGSMQYDEAYLDDVKETREWIVRMLSDRDNGVPGAIYYESSW
jgi:hypothetical protein